MMSLLVDLKYGEYLKYGDQQEDFLQVAKVFQINRLTPGGVTLKLRIVHVTLSYLMTLNRMAFLQALLKSR